MFPTRRYQVVAVLLGAALAPLFTAGGAPAQSRKPQQRLSSLQQQNALQQQQSAVQAALQQTNSLLQTAFQSNRVLQLGGTPLPLNYQQQAIALQIALQQTNALLQASFRQNSALSQTALRQQNTLQTALQQTLALQGLMPVQNGQLVPFLPAFQVQTLTQEQNSLMGLLTSQPPPLTRRMSRR
jgi:hypothetical protein